MRSRALLERMFARAQFYRWFQNLIGGTRARVWTIERYVRVKCGESVLDLGCGPGDLVRLLKMPIGARYLGIDISQKYLAQAKQYESDSVSFLLGDCTNFRAVTGQHKFNWVLCMGLLHHLSDDECDRLLAGAKEVLSISGTMVCLEPTLNEKQSRLTRAVMRQDRGRFVRFADDWQILYEKHFQDVVIQPLTGAFRIPYEKTVALLKSAR